MKKNMSPGKSLWLLKNGKILYYGGILSIFLYIPLMTLLPLLFTGRDISSIFVIVLAVMFFAIIAIVIISSDYANLYKFFEKLPANFVIEDINLIYTKITMKDERARRYTVKFHRFWGEPNLRDFAENPEYYEIWTPLRRSLCYPESDLHDRTDSGIKAIILNFFVPHTRSRNTSSSSTVFDKNLMKLVHLRYENEARTISSLRFVKLVKKQGGPILLAKLTKDASDVQIDRTMNLLKTLLYQIEH
jgi:hypothetical protein